MQLITALPVGSFVKINETIDGVKVAKPYQILATVATNPYGNDKVFCIRYRYTDKVSDKRFGISSTDTMYEGSVLDTVLQSEFSSYYDVATLSVIATSTVKCLDIATLETYTVGRKFFAPSPNELGGKKTGDPTDQINYYTKNADRVVSSDSGESGGQVFTRIPFSSNTIYNLHYNGDIRGVYTPNNSSAMNGIRPCCNILATAYVSDEPDEDGYYALIPDPDDQYLYVRFHCSLGTVDDMPLKVRVDLTTEGNPEITSLQVCNNYGDETPTWETMTVGEKHTFTNTTKTADNWEIGVKVEAMGENTIRVYEPFAIVQTEVDE